MKIILNLIIALILFFSFDSYCQNSSAYYYNIMNTGFGNSNGINTYSNGNENNTAPNSNINRSNSFVIEYYSPSYYFLDFTTNWKDIIIYETTSLGGIMAPFVPPDIQSARKFFKGYFKPMAGFAPQQVELNFSYNNVGVYGGKIGYYNTSQWNLSPSPIISTSKISIAK